MSSNRCRWETVVFCCAGLCFGACAHSPAKRVVEGIEERSTPPTFTEKLEGMQEDRVVFATPYGDINKGASMVHVMGVFGNPDQILSQDAAEIWYYRFGGEDVFVYFLNNKVTKVKNTLE